MYLHNSRQRTIQEEPSIFGGTTRINPNNRWIKLAKLINWCLIEDEYKKNFGNRQGEPPYSARFAVGVLLIKEKFQFSDVETVLQIKENIYLQYFLGLPGFNPDFELDPSSLSYFRKRISPEMLDKINREFVNRQVLLQNEDKVEGNENKDNSDDDGDNLAPPSSSNQGTLILDATCVPADIQFPTDVRLIHESRIKSEQLMDRLQTGRKSSKPRNYRNVANIEYKRFCRKKKPSLSEIRKIIRKQLGYLRRNLDSLAQMKKDSAVCFSSKEQETLATIQQVYIQQKQMYDTRTRRCENRIVSIHQPYVRPIKRGKVKANTEFGAKVSIAVVNGYTVVTKTSWDAYNESEELIGIAEQYKEQYGVFPKRILADKIYRTRKNLEFCKEHQIKLSGPALGKPPQDKALYNAQKQIERAESGERNEVEGKFGTAKSRYGLGRLVTRLKSTSETQIMLTFFAMNLFKALRALLYPFFTRRDLCMKQLHSDHWICRLKTQDLFKKSRNFFPKFFKV